MITRAASVMTATMAPTTGTMTTMTTMRGMMTTTKWTAPTGTAGGSR